MRRRDDVRWRSRGEDRRRRRERWREGEEERKKRRGRTTKKPGTRWLDFLESALPRSTCFCPLCYDMYRQALIFAGFWKYILRSPSRAMQTGMTSPLKVGKSKKTEMRDWARLLLHPGAQTLWLRLEYILLIFQLPGPKTNLHPNFSRSPISWDSSVSITT